MDPEGFLNLGGRGRGRVGEVIAEVGFALGGGASLSVDEGICAARGEAGGTLVSVAFTNGNISGVHVCRGMGKEATHLGSSYRTPSRRARPGASAGLHRQC